MPMQTGDVAKHPSALQLISYHMPSTGCRSSWTHGFVIPAGGPSGGDGGHGGNVWVEAEAGLTSLTIFRRQLHFRADKGGPGTGSNKHGANGPDLVIKVGRYQHADMCEDMIKFAGAEGCMACGTSTLLT